MKAFSEPRHVVFLTEDNVQNGQGFVIAEKTILYEVDNFSVCEGIVALITADYIFYVPYPKSSSAAVYTRGIQDVNVRKTSKYTSLINSVLSM